MATKFFKIVVHPRDNRLRIPSEFMRRHGRYLPDYVSLKAPNGSVRELRLHRSNGETWLHKGWQDFKEYYSIGFGQMLVFTYDGNSHFDVLIYGVNGMEIEYPKNNTNGDNKANARVVETVRIESKSESSDDDSVVFLKEISTNKKRKGKRKRNKSNEHYQQQHFYMLNEISDNRKARKPSRGLRNFSTHGEESSRTKAVDHNCRDEPVRASVRATMMKLECSDGSGNQYKKRVLIGVSKETSIAYQRANSSRFRNPFFISLMHPAYVSRNFILNIPAAFARANLPEKHNQLKLHNMKGKTWFVKCTIRENESKVTIGWKGFVQDNGLKVGDACVFEVNKINRLEWKVTIFRS